MIGISDTIKGEAIVAFVILKEGFLPNDEFEAILKLHVVKKIGPIARPEKVDLHLRTSKDKKRKDHAASPEGHC